VIYLKKDMPIPPPTKTIEQILKSLNDEGKGRWVLINGDFALISPKIQGKNVDYSSPVNGIILKAFWNLDTTEIRVFILKFTDDPKREDLYQ
jgi:hypothetical protein